MIGKLISDNIESFMRDRQEKYDKFLEICLSTYGINRSNINENADRIFILETPDYENNVIKRRFIIDGRYAFTILIKYKLAIEDNGYCFKEDYEKIIESEVI